MLLALAGAAQAQQCDPRLPQVAFVQENLQRAATEGDLPTAQDFADRSRRQMDQLAGAARRCGCATAQTKFEELTLELRRAQGIEARKELRELIGRTKLGVGDAVAALKSCADRR
jgi:hypothetical protein